MGAREDARALRHGAGGRGGAAAGGGGGGKVHHHHGHHHGGGGRKERHGDRGGGPEGPRDGVLPQPLAPSAVLYGHQDSLTPYEATEVLDVPQVYFLGATTGKVKGQAGASAPNHGYDDERGDYTIVVRDHLAYRFEILGVLGKGSFGQVLKCFDHKTKELRAVKIIRNKKRFHQQALIEVKILEHLNARDAANSRNVVKMQEHFYFRNHLCLVFELMSVNLYEFIKNNNFRGISLGLIRRFAQQILVSLAYFRKEKVIHCDLKPENILLQQPSKSAVKVIDFGSSCFETERLYTYIQSRFYRAPEVILGIPYGQPIDMWSFGCIVAELYTGLPLFPGENETEQLDCIMEVLGLPPRNMLNVASRRRLFFDSTLTPRMTANSRGRKRRPNTRDLSTALQCADETFLSFLTACLCWEPDDRMTPEEALKHAFIAEALHPPPPSGRNAYAVRGAARAAKASPRSPRTRMDPGAAGSTGHGYGRRPYYKETLKHAGHPGGNFLPSI